MTTEKWVADDFFSDEEYAVEVDTYAGDGRVRNGFLMAQRAFEEEEDINIDISTLRRVDDGDAS